jgi:hypothetical protein
MLDLLIKKSPLPGRLVRLSNHTRGGSRRYAGSQKNSRAKKNSRWRAIATFPL